MRRCLTEQSGWAVCTVPAGPGGHGVFHDPPLWCWPAEAESLEAVSSDGQASLTSVPRELGPGMVLSGHRVRGGLFLLLL